MKTWLSNLFVAALVSSIVALVLTWSSNRPGAASSTPASAAAPLEATPTPTNLYLPAIESNYLFFFDDFSNPASGWYIADSGTVAYSYQNGEYEILIRNQNSYAWASAHVGNVTNYTVDVDARRLSGTTTRLGILFDRVNSDHFYAFRVFPASQQYSVRRKDGSNWQDVIPWTSSTLVNGGTAINHLKLQKSGSQVALYANGNYLTTVTTANVSQNRATGLYAGTFGDAPGTARFDNFRIEGSYSAVSGASELAESHPTPVGSSEGRATEQQP